MREGRGQEEGSAGEKSVLKGKRKTQENEPGPGGRASEKEGDGERRQGRKREVLRRRAPREGGREGGGTTNERKRVGAEGCRGCDETMFVCLCVYCQI